MRGYTLEVFTIAACLAFLLWGWNLMAENYQDALSTCLERHSVDTCLHTLR